ncbi:MAG: hypothetical protein NUV60_00050 [Patescibacteria group bacterium]|nr:hypothetical protein [Patescibacteria group bacterium]
MEHSPERRKVEGAPVPSPTEPHVEMHHVHGEDFETATREEKIEIQKEILAYEEGVLTDMELNPTLTLKAKRILARNQKKIISEARENLERTVAST